MTTPASQLVGQTLDGGWKVEGSVERPAGATGGSFSVAYIVRSTRSGEKAFLKALDYARALAADDPAIALEHMVTAFIFERKLLERCKRNRLSRIVRIIDNGTFVLDASNPYSTIQYLIFELADGDIRKFVNFDKHFDEAWVLRTAHEVAAALQQLHNAEVAHQDLKPSNVLRFSKTHAKLADLGRASARDGSSPFDDLPIAGDLSYAPPELLYGHVDGDWRRRRIGCDMYLLGSLVCYLFTGSSMSHRLLSELDDTYHFKKWGEPYETVLPHLQNVFCQAIRDLKTKIKSASAEEIAQCVKQLCDPNPDSRGHPVNIRLGFNQYGLDRYISKFDLLARRAEHTLAHSK
ncbi:MAG: protein kinase [Bacteroidetes bacterium]|nr:protein kinase [Bacteroidota bacterium]MDE2672470.1 protein kinase [Bacteroidota bacterium]